MTMFNPLQKLLGLTSLGGLAGLGLGCVINVGPLDCSECGNTGCNSQQVGNICKCDDNYQFANDDPNDFDCDRIPARGGDSNCGGEENTVRIGDSCECVAGYNWCSTDPADLSCCFDDDQVGGSGGVGSGGPTVADTGDTDDTNASLDDTGTDTGVPGTCEQIDAPWNGVEPNPEDCADEPLVFCSNNAEEGPAGGRYWECIGGEWVENTTFGDEFCQSDGYDFSYGCFDNGVEIEFPCELGPGTPCSGPECDACADDDTWEFCDDGKLGADSCLRICMENGDADGVTYDFGFCSTDTGIPECICCDEGTEGCPI